MRFAKATGLWLLLAAIAVWLSGPVSALVLPQQTACGPGTIPCRTLAAMLQLASATVAVAGLAFVALRLCYRRIADTGRGGGWQFLGVLPYWLCCHEISGGALSVEELKLVLQLYPDYALRPPTSLLAAFAAMALIGLLPSAAAGKPQISPPATA